MRNDDVHEIAETQIELSDMFDILWISYSSGGRRMPRSPSAERYRRTGRREGNSAPQEQHPGDVSTTRMAQGVPMIKFVARHASTHMI